MLPYIILALLLVVAIVLLLLALGRGGRAAPPDAVAAARASGRRQDTGECDGEADRTIEEVRLLLLDLSETLQRAQTAGSRGAEVLGRVQRSLGGMTGRENLEEMKELLLAEVERLADANREFRHELDEAHANVQRQRQTLHNLRQTVRVDAVTLLPNAAALDERLLETLGRHYRYDESFALILLVVGDYDELAARYGEEGAGRLLRGVATKLRGTLRGTDFIARDTANRFVALLPHIDPDDAPRQAERLRAQIESTRLNLDGAIVTVRLSAAWATPRAGDTAERLLQRAEAAFMAPT